MNINLVMMIVIFLIGTAMGVYLLIKSMPKDYMRENYINNLPISENAKHVRLRELRKETAKQLTTEWFLEYLYGQRSAFTAWFTWLICMKISILGLIIYLHVNYTSADLRHTVFQPSFLSLDAFLTILGVYILWRCAKNSTRFWMRFSRIYCVGNLIGSFMIFTLVVIPLYLYYSHNGG